MFRYRWSIPLLLIAAFPAHCQQEIPMASNVTPIRAIYGFHATDAPFQGLSPDETAQQLLTWGCNAVFLKDDPEEVFAALKSAKIRRFRSLGFFQGADYWRDHPECRPVQADGTPLPKEEWYCGVCPNQDWLRAQKLEEIQALARSGKYDGIWLDFIRYPVHWESPSPNLPQTCFCPGCLDKFSIDSGIALPEGAATQKTADFILSSASAEWYAWRAEQITSLVRQAKEILRRENPDIKLGVFGLPWLRQEKQDAIVRIAGQDFASMAPWVDVFSPMVYHIMCGETPAWIHSRVQGFKQETGGSVIWPIIQGCNEPGTLTHEEFQEAIRQAERAPSGGVIIFGLNHLIKEDRLGALQEAWQTPASSSHEVESASQP